MKNAGIKIGLLCMCAMFSAPVLPFPALAEGQAARELAPVSYRFQLVYENGVIAIRPGDKIPYELIIEPFFQEPFDEKTAWRGDVIDVKGDGIATFYFDPAQGGSVKAPYFANASRVDFSNNRRELALSIPVGATSFCNDDGVCDADVGENARNCPRDCRIAPTTGPFITPEPPAPQNIKPAISTLRVVMIVLGITLGLAAAWVIKKAGKSA